MSLKSSVKISNNEVLSEEKLKINKRIFLKDKELKILCNQVAILLDSGCNIISVFEITKEQSNKKIQRVVDKIINDIQSGSSISEAFENTNAFSVFFINTIRAGEASGKLEYSMYNLASYYEKQHRIKSKIKTICIYPSFVCVLFLLSVIFSATNIIPNFESIFQSNSIEPPVITKIVIQLAGVLRDKYEVLVFVVAIFSTGLPVLFKYNNKFRYFLNRLLFKLPITKTMMKLIVTSRFCSNLRLLIESGVQIIDAVDIAGRGSDSGYAYTKILVCKDSIKKGNGISDSLKLSKIFPKSFIDIVKIGEASGKLEQCLKSSENFYDNQLETKIEQTLRAIEPTIILIIGIFVGIFVIAMVMPMFDLVNSF